MSNADQGIEEIRKQAGSVSMKQLAKKHGCHDSVIKRVITRTGVYID